MGDYRLIGLETLEEKAGQVLEIIKSRGSEIVDPTFRACDPEVRQAYLFGLKEGIFTFDEAKEAEKAYLSRVQSELALRSVDTSYGKLNSGGGWTSEGSQATERNKVRRYEERRRRGW